jgi:hypothetical protein
LPVVHVYYVYNKHWCRSNWWLEKSRIWRSREGDLNIIYQEISFMLALSKMNKPKQRINKNVFLTFVGG